ncbi:hypothetical protein SAY87_005221 [Trapa incisa]|uniref:Auxin-responsive protein n=1 Tax=Trapa incisa TaxID=236973 RepID=A0AAN7K9G5_9MYRT|nr:hypothetical protein SAY87_005221 [Trapa incisa]
MEVSRKVAVDMLVGAELSLGLPGGAVEALRSCGKRGFSETAEVDLKLNFKAKESPRVDPCSFSKEKIQPDPAKPPAKAQVVGWPPVRSYRKNVMAHNDKNIGGQEEAATGKATLNGAATVLVKVSMDGAPYLRKVDLKTYKSYEELSHALGKMFCSITSGNYEDHQGMIDFMNENKLRDLLNSSDYVPTYQDKDGDWMLVGDVPWEMFVGSCKRLRITGPQQVCRNG